MRNPDRIKLFMHELADIWEKECPDWRFGQLLMNILAEFEIDPFFIEDDKFMKEVQKFFSKKEN